MTTLYSILAPLSGALSMAYAIVGDYSLAALLCALSGAAALGAMLRGSGR